MNDKSARPQERPNLPGTIWDNHGKWHFRTILPGEGKRRDFPLCMPGSRTAMPSTKPKRIAEAAAWRVWEENTRIAETRKTRPQECMTVNELCDQFLEWARTYYRKGDGTPTTMVAGVRCSLREFRDLFGRRFVADLEHANMIELRESAIAKGLSRRSVNGRLSMVKQMMAWALEENLVYAQTKAELTQISLLKRGRSRAKEGKAIVAARADEVEAVAASVAPSLGDMIRVHMLTGMRPEEVCAMRWEDIERRDTIWVYRPRTEFNKNGWRGHPRAVVIGPRAQHLMSLREGEGEYVFSPKVAQVERFEAMRRARKTKVQPSQACRAKEEPMRSPGDCWTPDTYRRAIQRKCEQLGLERWNPNQLRHNCATEVRRQFGIDAARAVLGHFNGLRITDRYSFEAAEDEQIAVATPAMLALG